MEKLDDVDLAILRILQEDCRKNITEIADMVKIPKSTVHYRISRLEKLGYIEGYYAKISPEKMGKQYITITLVRAKYGPGYHEKVGEKISKLPGVWAVYFVFGETDFVVLSRTDSREEFMKTLEQIMNMEEIERTSTMIVAKVIKEDPRLQI
ncbi:MAG: Lrp/AsnC family transcriptional regulator [Candidatus Methanodesulfokora sp.]|jgi:DNA-binding Lrp family transcriptional regulator